MQIGFFDFCNCGNVLSAFHSGVEPKDASLLSGADSKNAREVCAAAVSEKPVSLLWRVFSIVTVSDASCVSSSSSLFA